MQRVRMTTMKLMAIVFYFQIKYLSFRETRLSTHQLHVNPLHENNSNLPICSSIFALEIDKLNQIRRYDTRTFYDHTHRETGNELNPNLLPPMYEALR